MYPKKVANDTAKVLQSYLTYQAVRTIIEQLSETNPSLALWLSEYSSGNRVQDGEAYLQGLMQENKELMLRVLTVRAHLAESILELLPSMVMAQIEQSNTDHRRQLLERLTRTAEPSSPSPASTSGDDSPPPESGSQDVPD
ncbi:MAG: chaperonin family protein RbcX [Phormidium sp. BM_Day4_Bin.17]|nr:chaperonin family protein RbcX [Phormidium sp. BM_Day4_Bin.17]UCJ13385.1 MAG: RbcX chaperonin protein [Phormidium sp. PBR-2020]